MGFIKLPDNLNEWAWFDDKNTVYVYVWLLLKAAWKDGKYHGIEIKRGQLVTTYPEISKECDVTNRQARTILDRLKSTGKVSVKLTSKFSIITLIDYDLGSVSDSQNDCQLTAKQQSMRQSNDTPTLLNTNSRISDKQIADNNARAREAPEPQSPDVKKPNKPEKRKFAEFVSMTNDEYSLLVTKLGEQGAKRCIEILDNYKGQSGRTYKSDYRAILNWVVSRYNEENARRKPAQNKPSGASDSGNPFLDMLRELEEKEANEIDVQGNITGNGGA